MFEAYDPLPEEYEALLVRLDCPLTQPADGTSAPRWASFTVDEMPSPWASWALIGLVAYGARKRWAYEVVESRLAPALAGPGAGLEALEDLQARGIVPGLPEWEFELESGTALLAHRPSGETVHVDLLNGEEVCERWQFLEHLRDNRRPGPAARRLLELYPHLDALELAIDELSRLGLLAPIDDTGFRLSPPLVDLGPAVMEFLGAWEDPARRARLAAWIGDWPAAEQAARAGGDGGLENVAGERALECLERRRLWLRERADGHGLDGELLHALRDAGEPGLPAYLSRAIGRPGEATEAALELVGDDPSHLPAVSALFDRVGRDADWDHLGGPCARYLARHGHRVAEAIGRLAVGPYREPGLAAGLALMHEPAMALPLLRVALRSRWYLDRLMACALLALVDQPWGRAELLAVLRESDDADETEECRAALRESRCPAARAAAWEWEVEHPGDGEVPWLSDRCIHQIMGGCDRTLAVQMGRLRRRIDVDRLRRAPRPPG